MDHSIVMNFLNCRTSDDCGNQMNEKTKSLVRALQILLDLDMSTMSMIEENTPSIFIAPFDHYIYMTLPWYILYKDEEGENDDDDDDKYPSCDCKCYYIHVILPLNSPYRMSFRTTA